MRPDHDPILLAATKASDKVFGTDRSGASGNVPIPRIFGRSGRYRLKFHEGRGSISNFARSTENDRRRAYFSGVEKMKDKFLAFLGSFLLGGGAPASANWIEVGHLVVHDQGERFMRDFAIPEPVEKLQLKAHGGEIFCRSVYANLADGSMPEIYQGLLQTDKPTDVELPGNGQRLQSLTFQCGALVRGSTQIDIMGDVGRNLGQSPNDTKS
jgi:hypothetical protein